MSSNRRSSSRLNKTDSLNTAHLQPCIFDTKICVNAVPWLESPLAVEVDVGSLTAVHPFYLGLHLTICVVVYGANIMNKVFANAEDAIFDIRDGATLMVGGFGLCGIPENLISALVKKGVKNLHTISNNVGVDDFGLGLLLRSGQITSHKGSYVGENRLLEEMVLGGRIDLELIPQGTFAERIRAGGAGIPAFFTPTGVGTIVAEGKDTREFDGRLYVMERWLRADFALVKAWKGDKWGNLVYRKTAQNFNPIMAAAAKVTIAEVEHLVDPGEIPPEQVHTPSIYVKRIFQAVAEEKRIERRTVRKATA